MLENAILSIPPEHRGKLNLSISFNQWMRGYKTFMEGEHYLNVTIPTLSKYRPVRILATDSLFDSETWKSLFCRAAQERSSCSGGQYRDAARARK